MSGHHDRPAPDPRRRPPGRARHRRPRAPRRLRVRASGGPGVRIDLVLGMDTRGAARSDDLQDTVDYGTLVDQVRSAVANDPVDLIETLAQRIADVCLRNDQVDRRGGHRAQAPRPDPGDVRGRRPDHQPERRDPVTSSDPRRTDRSPVTESRPNIVDADTITGEMHPIRRAVISIGSNLGERRINLQGAVDSLADTPEVWVTAVSAGLRDRAGRRPRGLQGLPERDRAARHHAVGAHAARAGPGRRVRLRARARAASATRRARSTST